MADRKKIAVMLYGLPRSSSLCAPSIRQSIIKSLASHCDVRVFCCLLEQSFVHNPWSGENAELDQENYSHFEDFSIVKESSESIGISELNQIKRFGDAWDNGFVSTRNALRQLWATRRAYDLSLPWQADYSVFCRVDLLVHDPFDFATILTKLRGKRDIIVPNWQWWDGVNDRFAVAAPEAACVYGRRLEQVTKYCQETGLPFHAERFLGYALRKQKVSVKTVPWRASRTRLGGVIVSESFRQDSSPSHQIKRAAKAALHRLGLINAYQRSR